MSLARHINSSSKLVQPRENHPYINERLLMGCNESNQTKELLPILTYHYFQSAWYIPFVVQYISSFVSSPEPLAHGEPL